MRFQTPQFIDIEDRIFGPLTLKQFIYLAGCAGLAFLWYRTLPLILAIWLIIPTLALGVSLAFVKYNNKPFIALLEALFHYALRRKLCLWRKEESAKPVEAPQKGAAAASIQPTALMPKLSGSKLKDMAWTLDVNKDAGPEGGKRDTQTSSPSNRP